MALASSRRAALGWLFAASACGSSSHSAPGTNSPSDGGTGDAGTPTIAFQFGSPCASGGGMCAAPSQDMVVEIDAPLAAVTVGLEGAYADASLAADSVTLSGGRGTVTLHTSSVPATFRLIARSSTDASVNAALGVAVSATGFATLRVLPSYKGDRATPSFLAVQDVNTACTTLSSAPPSDSAPWTSAPPAIRIQLTVPAGEPFAVDVRSGHYAYGCADVPPLGANASLEQTVDVYDLPIALGDTDLDVTFAFAVAADSGVPGDWKAALDAAGGRVTAEFFAGTDEASALLDAVRATITSTADQSQFDSLRSAGRWDTTAATWLTSHAPSINARVATWVAATDTTGIGPIVLHLAPGTTSGTATISPASFGSLSAASASIAPPAPFAWTADADDTVHLQGAIDLASTPLVAHLADAIAAQAVPQATDTPSAIAIAIDGPGLASALVGSGVLYGQCAASCAADAIRTAIAATWATASAPTADGSDDVHVALTASAPATVGDDAQPIAFSGGWVGGVDGAGAPTAFSIKGTVSATPPSNTP